MATKFLIYQFIDTSVSIKKTKIQIQNYVLATIWLIVSGEKDKKIEILKSIYPK